MTKPTIKRHTEVPGIEHAHSLMRQAINSLLRYKITDKETDKETDLITIELKAHVANYLIESMRLVLSGEDASKAFCLGRKKPRTTRRRNFDIARYVEMLREDKMLLNDALELAADKFFDRTHRQKLDRFIDTANSAYESGMADLGYYKKNR